MTTRKKLFCDLETFSPTPLRDGTWRYAESAEVLLFPYAIDDGPAAVWDLTTGEVMPNQLEDAIYDDRVLTVWHNGGGFDRTVMKYALPKVYDALPIERIYDTMVQALAHALPGSLDTLCEVLNVAQDERKLKTGREFINLFCKPPAKNMKRGRATRLTHPKEWEGFKEYARMDIPSMRAVHKLMPKWNYPYEGPEMDLWRLDQRINARGFAVDLDLAHGAIRAVDRAQKVLAARTVELTGGEVERATQRDKLLAHLLAEYGVDLPNLQKSTLERRVDDQSLPRTLRELLNIRLQASSSSTSKYRTVIKGASSDGRVRGCLQFDGASRTRRWCIAGGSQVKVKTDLGEFCEKAIEQVLLSDLVWDGEAWVAHEGVVFSGVKEVITHDNVVATTEHIVYTSDAERTSLGTAKSKGLLLWTGNIPCTV